MNGTVILNFLAVVIWGDQVIKFLSIFASPKKILYRNQSLGAPALWAFWAQVKYPLKPLLPKEPKVWDSEVSPEVERSRNYGTEMNHRCGEASSLSPRLCPHLALHTTSTRLLDRLYSPIEYFMESAGVRYFRTSCWHTSRNRKSEISDTKTAFPEIPYKAFSMWYCVC